MGRHWPDEIAERRRVKRADRARTRAEVLVELLPDEALEEIGDQVVDVINEAVPSLRRLLEDVAGK